MRDQMVGKIFEDRVLADRDFSFASSRLVERSMDFGGRRGRQHYMGTGSKYDFGTKPIAPKSPAGWIEHHHIQRAIRQPRRLKRLQRQRESAVGQNCSVVAPLEDEAQKSVASDALRSRKATHA
jgi:hypothetical protein